jgi:hypothetical protein
MEYRTPKSILILLICWGLSTTALRGVASAAGSAGTSGADFLEIGVGSRPLGMGEAFTAGTDDINSIYYNPAGLGTIRYPVLSIMHQELILDSRFENISAAFPLFNGFMGVSNSVFWVPPFDKIDVDGNKTGTVNFYNACFTLAYGQSLGFMEVGGSVKYIHQKIDTLTLHSAAVDFGVMKRLYMYSPFDAPIRNFVLGMSLQNIGTKAKDDELPRLMRMGASYYPTRWFGLNLDLMQYFIDTSDLYDFTYGFEESLRANLGMELSYFNIIALRAGYRFNDSGTYSLGMGFNYAVKDVGFSIDASYSDTGIFGPVYSFSISFKLIPKIITVEDQLKAEAHYQKAIKYYIANDIDSALDEFRSCRDYNPYHKNVKKKIKDLEYLKELKRQNEELDKRKTF